MNDSVPAFPLHAVGHVEPSQGAGHENLRLMISGGMTLRDHFASLAARSAADAVCSELEEGNEGKAITEAERHARACYMVADAMLKAREDA